MRSLALRIKIWVVLVVIPLLVPLTAQATGPTSTAQQFQISTQVAFGMGNQFPDLLYYYQEPTSNTAVMDGSTNVVINANSTNTAISTATLFPGVNTPVLWGIAEITNPALPLAVGLSSSGPRMQMAAGGFWITRVASGSPTFYVDNTDPANKALVRVFMISN